MVPPHELHTKVVSNIRLAVHQKENRAAIGGDPGAQSIVQGYAGHYCNVPRRQDPDGLEFEVMFLVPAHQWGDEENEAIIRPLDLNRELERFGGVR